MTRAMDHFDPYKVPLASCPEQSELQDYLSFPSVSFIFFLLALASLLFAVFTGFKYNSVMVFNKPVRKPQISNSLWIVYFVIIFIKATIDSIEFAVITVKNEWVNFGLVVTSLLFYGLSSFALTLALDHQRKYRSDYGTPIIPKKSPQSSTIDCSSTPLIINDRSVLNYAFVCTKIKTALSSPITPYMLLLLLYGLGLYGVFMSSQVTYFWLFIATYGLQRIPIVILMIWIVLNTGKSKMEGPSSKSKAILCVATLLELANNLPITIWASIIKDDNCPFKIFSFVDLVHIFFCTAQILFFIFLRQEFQRNKEQFVYTTVQTHKDYEQIGIDWRKFNDEPILPQSHQQ